MEVRRHIGMVFQKPNPFPKTIYENIAFGARINGFKGNMDELVETSLRRPAVWGECKDKLQESGLPLSGGSSNVCDRDPQHAAGCAGFRYDCLLQRR